MTIGFVILGIYVVAVMNMHYRGQVRFPWARQFLTHTNYLAPYNLLMNLSSKLPNKPLLNVDELEDLKTLRDNWQVMRDEALQLSADGKIKAADGLNDVGFNSFFRTGWTRFYLKWYEDYLPSAVDQCPKTVEVLKKTPSIKAAMFASLPPGGELKQHRDPYAGSLRYHLGLVTPNSDDCYILVDGHRHSWRDGKDVLFDETYIHEAYNKSDQPRIILFADVHRPMRFKLVDKINHWVSDNIIRISATNNEETEKVGALNRSFETLYKFRTLSRKIKKWNKPFYIVLKYGLFIGLIYLLFF
ncbi:MAG: aspartyl/asparaginyl beta-hydroxylase domain-containing protein [Arenicella sp.]|nr:aspartyl/asparaginyl beta-hydroxylase domain-containing protein [Arenicella sp.]